MVKSDISNQDQFINREKKKYLIKNQIYGSHYCSELLDTNLPRNFKEIISKVHSILLKDNLSESDLDQVYDLINDLSIRDLSFEMRILLKQLSDTLILPEEAELFYNNEIEGILDPYLEVKLKIYNHFKKSEYSKALSLCNQILENDKLENYDKFLFLGYKTRILAETQDFESANNNIDLALDCYELFSENERVELQLRNKKIDNYSIRNLQDTELDEFLIVKISSLYIIKCFYMKNQGLSLEALKLIDEIIPQYSEKESRLSYADLLNEKGNILYKIGRNRDALGTYEIVFNIYLGFKDLQRQKGIFNNISRILIDLEEWNLAFKFVEKGLTFSKSNDFNEILIISKSILLHKMNKNKESINILTEFISNSKQFHSTNGDVLFYLNIGLIIYLIITVENKDFTSLNLFNRKIKLLEKNKFYSRIDMIEKNQFICGLIKSNFKESDIILNLRDIKRQLMMADLPLIIKEILI